MSKIVMDNVCLDIPVLDANLKDFRKSILNKLGSSKIKVGRNNVPIVRAIVDFSLTIHEGDAVGFFGKNGAGKSTVLRLISGIYSPTRGRISVTGKVSPLLALGGGLDQNLSGRENLKRLCRYFGYNSEEIKSQIPTIIEFADLEQFIELPVRTYSSGMLMRLAFSVAVWKKPDILVLDELFHTGDSDFAQKAEARMALQIANSGIFVFASQSHHLLFKYCNRFIEIQNGAPKEYSRAQFEQLFLG